MTEISRAQARRIALAAQGFLDPVHTPPTMRTFARTVQRTGVLQIDSVNVLERAHYMPLYSRMGPYDRDLLRRASEQRPRRMVEYWAHVAAYMPVDLWPAMRHRMQDNRDSERSRQIAEGHAGLITDLLSIIAAEGPRTASQLDQAERDRAGSWWNWSDTKVALEYLFGVGDLAIAGRNAQFERLYDLPERVLPAEVLAMPELTRHEAAVELTRRAARSHGVGTVAELADYYRMRTDATKTALDSLIETGEVTHVQVEGAKHPAYLDAAARIPRRVKAATLLSPFDPVVWHRGRSEHLFDFHYRIEIYTPEHKRIYGYYVLPFLLDEQIAARVDLKADRKSGTLLVQSAHLEPDAPERTAEALATELWRLAGWLGLGEIKVKPRGDLAAALAAEFTVAPIVPAPTSHQLPQSQD